MVFDDSDRSWLTDQFKETNRRIDGVHSRVTDLEVQVAEHRAAPCDDVQSHEKRYDHMSRRGTDITARFAGVAISLLAFAIAVGTFLWQMNH